MSNKARARLLEVALFVLLLVGVVSFWASTAGDIYGPRPEDCAGIGAIAEMLSQSEWGLVGLVDMLLILVVAVLMGRVPGYSITGGSERLDRRHGDGR